MANEAASFGGGFGGGPCCLAWIATPFHPRKGQNRRETVTQSHGPLGTDPPSSSFHARLPGCRRDGQVKSPSVPELGCDKKRCSRSSGSRDRVLLVIVRPALLFPLRLPPLPPCPTIGHESLLSQSSAMAVA